MVLVIGSASIVVVLISLKVSSEVSVLVFVRLPNEVTVEVSVTVVVDVRSFDVVITVVVVSGGHLSCRPKRPCEIVVEDFGIGLSDTIEAEMNEGKVASKTTRRVDEHCCSNGQKAK